MSIEMNETSEAMNSGTITSEVFMRELATFRNIMQDNRNSIATMDRAHGCLFLITNRVDPKDRRKELTEQTWDAITEEFTRRKALMMMAFHPLE